MCQHSSELVQCWLIRLIGDLIVTGAIDFCVLLACTMLFGLRDTAGDCLRNGKFASF